jgi:hypothetical protein
MQHPTRVKQNISVSQSIVMLFFLQLNPRVMEHLFNEWTLTRSLLILCTGTPGPAEGPPLLLPIVGDLSLGDRVVGVTSAKTLDICLSKDHK